MEEPEKPFACNLPNCGMTFTNEDHLNVHTKKHDMMLQLGSEQKAAFVADQTPTPTRFIRNCEEVGLFQDLQNVNPFDEGFKRAMETKHGLLSLENAIANTASDDVLHTPQMVFPLVDGGDSALYQRNVTISRSSSDESGTIKEYETTTISKLTNEVTTISRIVGNREHNDTSVKTDTTNKEVNETVSYTNNVIISNIIRKDQSSVNVESSKSGPIVLYSDTIKSQSPKENVVIDNTKLQVPNKMPVMSQKSIDLVVESLTADISNMTDKKEPKTPKIVTKPKRVKKTTKSDKDDTEKIEVKKFKTEDEQFEVILKFPNGKCKTLKSTDENITKNNVKPVDAIERLRKTILDKQNNVVPVSVPIIQIPTGTLIPVNLVTSNNIAPKLPVLPFHQVKVGYNLNQIESNLKRNHSKNNNSKVNKNHNNVTKIKPIVTKTQNNQCKDNNIVDLTDDCVDCSSEKSEESNINTGQNVLILDTQQNINNLNRSGRSPDELERHSAASKRYRDRVRLKMSKQLEENRLLKEANLRLKEERAALRKMIIEHMKKCPHADDLRNATMT